MKKTLLLLCFIISFASSIWSQKVEIIDFKTLEKIINTQNDTLYVVNFWATWCKPCVEELPFLNESSKQFENQAVSFLFISLDYYKTIESKLLPFLAKKKLLGKVFVLDAPNQNEWIPKISEQWDGAIPVTLFTKNGDKKFYNGSFESSSVINRYINLLNNKNE